MLAYREREGGDLALWELAVRYEAARGGITEAEVLEKMDRLVEVFESSITTGLGGTEFEDRILPLLARKKYVVIKQGQVRDGASGAWDIVSLSWWVHDQLCADGAWADGSDVTPWQAACVLGDILREEGRWFRATTWKYATLLFGCKRSHERIDNA